MTPFPTFTEDQQKLLKSLKAQAVYLFGSRALGYESSLSDYDYAVLLKEKGHSRGDKIYFVLYLSPSVFSSAAKYPR